MYRSTATACPRRAARRDPTPAPVQRLEARRLLSAGDPDVTFDTDGIASVDLPGVGNEFANAVAVDANGRTLLAGRGNVGGESDFFVARLRVNGGLDPAFGGGDGFVTLDFAVNDEAQDLAIDSTGRIVVVGTSSAGAGPDMRDFAVARLTDAGVPDDTFNGDGRHTVDFNNGNDDAMSVALHGSAIYVGGFKDQGSTGQFLVAKITDSGGPDLSYSTDGEVNFAFGGNNDSRCYDIAVDHAGRVVMAGTEENLSVAGHSSDIAVARLGTNAVLDPAFGGGDGFVIVNVSQDDEGRAVGIDLRGRIVVGGFDEPPTGGPDMVAVRLTDAGVLDNTFSGDGKFGVDLGGTERVTDLAIQADGTVMLSGPTSVGSFQAAVVQVEPFRGNLSTSFGDGGDGIQLVNFGVIEDGFAIGLAPDGRPVIAGNDGGGRLAVGRLRDMLDQSYAVPTTAFPFFRTLLPLADGKLLTLSGIDGDVRRWLPGGTPDPTFPAVATGMDAKDVAVDGEGRIIVGGSRFNAPSARIAVVRRFTAAGALDPDFGTGGEKAFYFNASDEASDIEAVAIDASNRVIVAGLNHQSLNTDVVVARLTAGGQLDGTFDGDGINRLLSSGTFSTTANDVIVQPWDGRIVVVGETGSDGFALRLQTNGNRDASFGPLGVRQFDFSVGALDSVAAKAVALDAARNVVVGGTHSPNEEPQRGFVLRFEPDGDFDDTFSGDGELLLGFVPSSERVFDVDIDRDGNIHTFGEVDVNPSSSVEDFRPIVRRLLADGSAGDVDFSGDGAWVSPVTPGPHGRAGLADGAVYLLDGRNVLRLNVEPAVVDFEFDVDARPQRMRVQFNDDVGDTLADIDLDVQNTTLGTTVPRTAYDLASYNRLTNTAEFTFNTVLVGGDYTVTFSAAGIRNRQGMTLAGDRTREFSGGAVVLNRRAFYNRSAFDGNSAAAEAADEGAIAPDKQGLLPGQTAGDEHYTSFTRGINGVIFDIENLADDALEADDFVLRIGNDNNPASWAAGPAPAQILVRPGAGLNGSDRVHLAWGDDAARNTWLQVTVKTNPDTGLPAPDVFYFGNLPGDTFNSAAGADFFVNSLDVQRTRVNQFQAAPITTLFDHNRSGNIVNSVDLQLSRINQFTTLNRITVPAAAAVRSQPAVAPALLSLFPPALTPRRPADGLRWERAVWADLISGG